MVAESLQIAGYVGNEKRGTKAPVPCLALSMSMMISDSVVPSPATSDFRHLRPTQIRLSALRQPSYVSLVARLTASRAVVAILSPRGAR